MWLMPGAGVGDLLVRRADPLGQHHGRALHAVAQPGQLDEGLALHGPAQHGHRVGVVEQDRVRAVALHVPDDVQHHRDGAQGAENARRAARIADVDIHAIFLGDLDVVAPDLCAASQDGDQDDIGVSQRFRPVQRGFDPGGVFAHVDDALDGSARELQPFGSISIRDSVASCSSGKVSISRTRSRVNPRLPAPMNAILTILSPSMYGFVLIITCRFGRIRNYSME